MMGRLEHERRESGRAVLRAQEQERTRIAQDLHDEVNQALTGILLRLEATMSDAPPHLVGRARRHQGARHPGDGGAAAPRARAAPDRARRPRPRPRARVADRRLRRAHGHPLALRRRRPATCPELSDEEQLVIYRVTQESLSNVVQHAGASRVDVELNTVGRTVLRVRDDGKGFESRNGHRGRNRLGVSGMRERALLVGGNLSIFSTPGEGTTIELTMGAT